MSKKKAATAEKVEKSDQGSAGGRKTAPGMHYLFALAICLCATAATLPIKFAGPEDAQTTFWFVFIICLVLDVAVLATWLRDGARGYKH